MKATQILSRTAAIIAMIAFITGCSVEPQPATPAPVPNTSPPKLVETPTPSSYTPASPTPLQIATLHPPTNTAASSPVPSGTSTPKLVETPTPSSYTPGSSAPPQIATLHPPTNTAASSPVPSGTSSPAPTASSEVAILREIPTPPPPPPSQNDIAGIAISPQNPELSPGDLLFKFTVFARYADNTYGPLPEHSPHDPVFSQGQTIVQSSPDTAHPVLLTREGLLRRMAAANTIEKLLVNASYGPHQATILVTLLPPPKNTLEYMDHLILKVQSPSIQVGDTITLGLRAVYQGGRTGQLPTDVQATPTFASSNELVATIDPTGNITGIAPGLTTITARAFDHLATTSIIVLPLNPLTNVQIGCQTSDGTDPVLNTFIVHLTPGHDASDALSLARQYGGTIMPYDTPRGHLLQLPCIRGAWQAQVQHLARLASRIKGDSRVKEAILFTHADPNSIPFDQTATPSPEKQGTRKSHCDDLVAISTQPAMLDLDLTLPASLKTVTLHCADRSNVVLPSNHPDINYALEDPLAPLHIGPEGKITNVAGPTANHVVLVTHGVHRKRLTIRVRHLPETELTGTEECNPQNNGTGLVLAELAPHMDTTLNNPQVLELASQTDTALAFTFQPHWDPMREKLHAVVLTVRCTSREDILKKARELHEHPDVSAAGHYFPLLTDSPKGFYKLATHDNQPTLKIGDSLSLTPVAHYRNGTQYDITDAQEADLVFIFFAPELGEYDPEINKLTALTPGQTTITIVSKDPQTQKHRLNIHLTVTP